jgi:hypothetical protein
MPRKNAGRIPSMPGDRAREVEVEAIVRYLRQAIPDEKLLAIINEHVPEGIADRARKLVTPGLVAKALVDHAESIAEEALPRDARKRSIGTIILGKAAETTEREIGEYLVAARATIDARIDKIVEKEISEYFHGNAGEGVGKHVADAIERTVRAIIESKLEFTIRLKGDANGQ